MRKSPPFGIQAQSNPSHLLLSHIHAQRVRARAYAKTRCNQAGIRAGELSFIPINVGRLTLNVDEMSDGTDALNSLTVIVGLARSSKEERLIPLAEVLV